MVKLQSILFTELHAWMESWQLGLSFEATYTEARRLIRYRLQHLSPEQHIWVKTLLTTSEQTLASDQQPVHPQAIAMLGRHCSRTASRRLKSPAGAVELLVVGLAMW